MKHFSIAIDGPAGAGKSTIAKKVAAKLDFVYIDTGAMYRAIGLFFRRRGINGFDAETIAGYCDDIDISITYAADGQHVILNGEDVTGLIRTPEAGEMASAVSTHSIVRRKLVSLQQKLAEKNNVIMDGRDIASVVLPNADLKIFLTASVSVRAERRYEELLAKGVSCDLEEIKKDIADRDYRDTHRENSPLVKVDDALLVDTSDMDIDEVCDTIIDLYDRKVSAK